MSFINRVITGPLGGLLLRPWYDPFALRGILRTYLPLSRAWAAASDSGGDAERFAATVGGTRPMTPAIAKMVAAAAQHRAAYESADARFIEAAFARDATAEDFRAAKLGRHAAADAWMKTRFGFLPAHLSGKFPATVARIDSPSAIESRHGARRAEPAAAYRLGEVAVETTATLTQPDRELSWLRYADASGEDGTAWASVEQPKDGKAAGTIIFLHGVLMEREFFANLYDYVPPFLRTDPSGGPLRVIQPEGPWHGRRMKAGWYGGEPLLANPVGGALDYFASHVVEAGNLIAWARRTYGGPVAVGGVSLGALTAQLVASAARHWPAEARPDAVLLVTTTDSMVDVAYSGSLAAGLKIPAAMAAAGWSEAELNKWRPLLEPGESAVPPERMVVVLGTTDTVTPIVGGDRLVKRWKLPPDNIFRWNGGHFTAGFSILRDARPVLRLRRVMADFSAHIR